MADKYIEEHDDGSATVVIADVLPISTDLLTVPASKFTTISGILYNATFTIGAATLSTRGHLASLYNQVPAQATTAVAGIAEIATAAEVNTGTSDAVVVSPNALADSNFGIRTLVFGLNGTTALASGIASYLRIPPHMTGMDLVAVRASVGDGAAGSSSSGNPTFQVRNVTDNNQMLTTNLSVDANEYTSATAAVPAVINTAKDDVVTDDLIEAKCVIAGTGVTYATVQADFKLP
jgi:hypothetical protein